MSTNGRGDSLQSTVYIQGWKPRVGSLSFLLTISLTVICTPGPIIPEVITINILPPFQTKVLLQP